MAATHNKAQVKKSSWIVRLLPIVRWLPNYDRTWLRPDLIAGLTVWALMVPTPMGYATISGVPVQYGLYAAAVVTHLKKYPADLPASQAEPD